MHLLDPGVFLKTLYDLVEIIYYLVDPECFTKYYII